VLGRDAMTTVSSSPLGRECALVAELERERGFAFDEGKLSPAVRKGDVGE